MRLLQNALNIIGTDSIQVSVRIASSLVEICNINFIPIPPLASLLEDPVTTRGIPCNDPFVQLMSNGLGFFLNTLMQIGCIIGLICIVLGGLLRISALTTQKKENKDERMFLSKSAFICAIIFLIPTLLFFILLVLLPHWYGLGNNTCH